MALYLWHMIPVVIVAIIGYPAGLLPQPVEGGASWWLARLEWVVILSLVTAVELALLWWGRRLFAAPLPALNVLGGRWAEPIMLAGASMACVRAGVLRRGRLRALRAFPPADRGDIRRRRAAGGAVPAGSRPRVGTPMRQ